MRVYRYINSAAVVSLLLLSSSCRKTSPDHSAPHVSQPPPANNQAAQFKTQTNFFARPAFAYAQAAAKEVSLSDIAEKTVESVVNVSSTRLVEGGAPSPFDPFSRPEPRRQARGVGSGVVVTADGVVLTNHHVVAQSSEIQVTFANGDEYEAKVIGSDPKSDVAVLRLKNPPKDLKPLPMGDSSKLRLAEVVLAIGNPFGVGKTVTLGIVSAIGRADMGIVDYEDFIQTDAAINPGNSGGALVNMRGELVGINTAILSKSGGYQGIGFAIPTAMVRPIMESLIKHGKVIRGWLGVVIQPLTESLAMALNATSKRGIVVADVQANSPAARAGLKRGDIITSLDGKTMDSPSQLRTRIASVSPGATVKLDVLRGGKSMPIAVALTELPSDQTAKFGADQGALGGLSLQTLNDAIRQKLELPPDLTGVLVAEVDAESPAAAAGLQPGDIILELNRRRINNTQQFSMVYQQTRGKVLLLIYREGSTMYLLLEK